MFSCLIVHTVVNNITLGSKRKMNNLIQLSEMLSKNKLYTPFLRPHSLKKKMNELNSQGLAYCIFIHSTPERRKMKKTQNALLFHGCNALHFMNVIQSALLTPRGENKKRQTTNSDHYLITLRPSLLLGVKVLLLPLVVPLIVQVQLAIICSSYYTSSP